MIQNNQLLYGLSGLLIGGVIVWLLATNAVNNNKTGMIQMMGIRQMNSQNTTSMMGNIDRHFIEQMIPHHEDAITMAKLAQTKAKRTEVKQLAENIIDSQGKEISQMTVWYKDWFGTDVSKDTPVMGQHGMTQRSEMHMGIRGDESDMARLEQSEDFDKAFVEEMIPHHQMAVMMATMLKNSTKRPEMTKLAEDIISAQMEEIEQMRKWLSEWK